MAFNQGAAFGRAYCGWILLVLMWHIVAQLMPVCMIVFSSGAQADWPTLHVHHWYWAFLAAHMAIFDSALSAVSQTIFLGVYIHGAASFGLEAIFEHETKVASHTLHTRVD